MFRLGTIGGNSGSSEDPSDDGGDEDGVDDDGGHVGHVASDSVPRSGEIFGLRLPQEVRLGLRIDLGVARKLFPRFRVHGASFTNPGCRGVDKVSLGDGGVHTGVWEELGSGVDPNPRHPAALRAARMPLPRESLSLEFLINFKPNRPGWGKAGCCREYSGEPSVESTNSDELWQFSESLQARALRPSSGESRASHSKLSGPFGFVHGGDALDRLAPASR